MHIATEYSIVVQCVILWNVSAVIYGLILYSNLLKSVKISLLIRL